MNVTIIGTGKMGRGIGYRAVAGGHNVTLVDRDPEKAEMLAKELKGVTKSGANVQTAGFDNANLGDVVILAVPYGAISDLAKRFGSQLSGKAVVDISNPLNSSYDGLAISPDTSAAEELAKAVPGAKVVKAFNTTFASTLVAGKVKDQPLDVFLAGDDDAAKAKVAQLVTDGGLVAIDVGPLFRARQLEAMALLGITLQMKHNWGFATAWKLVRP